MEKPSILFLLLILMFFSVFLCSHPVVATVTRHSGYTAVREGAHLFWWYYKSGLQLQDQSSKWPIILWLEGGPGSSGAIGDFLQIGPETVEGEERRYTWLWKADLLFVDSPVGTGFSYVDNDNDSLLVTTDTQAAHDLFEVLRDLLWNPTHAATFKNQPLYIYGEGYGGKIAAYLGLLVSNAIAHGEFMLKLGGVILADSWISPADSALALGPLLNDLSRLSSIGLKKANILAPTIQLKVRSGEFAEAKVLWDALVKVIAENSGNVDLRNVMLDTNSPLAGTRTIYDTARIMREADSRNFSTHVLPNDQSPPFDFTHFMNVDIRQRLKIPPHVTWMQWNQKVFNAMSGDYMKPRIHEVALLLVQGVRVTIINGQYDVVCSTKGTEAWIEKLTGWIPLTTFLDTKREVVSSNHPVHVRIAGFKTAHQNLAFYSIRKASHFIMVDQPHLHQRLVGEITNSPPTI